jgi:hypothetical protein
MDKGHWEFKHEFDITEWFGFIYRITEIATGKEYIGKKQFHQHLRKAVKGKVNKKKVIKESDWKTYTSSSTHINKAIELVGKDKFRFEIESLHKTRASLVYAEVRYQITEEVLRARMPDGTRKYFNGIISGVKFLPPVEHPDEILMKKVK